MSGKEASAPWDNWDTHYREFQDQEGLPVYTGLAVEDVRELEVEEWDRTGGKGAFVNLIGMEGTCDIQILDIPPGTELKPQRHLHDSLVWVVSGSGFTTIGNDENEITFEWGKNAAFYIPQNTRYVHTNGSSDETVRLVIETPLPFYYSLFRDHGMIWENDYDYWGSVGNQDFYSTESLYEGGSRYVDTNFIPNVATFDQIPDNPDRGGSGGTIVFPLKSTALWSHISEFSVGQYKKAHRHLCGANVMLLSGEGYSLLWQEGDDERIRVDWSPYALYDPPTLWYHQHFNLSNEPARYLVFHTPVKGTGLHRGDENDALFPHNDRNTIEYHEEDPEIRAQYKQELEKVGIDFQMDPEQYDPEKAVIEKTDRSR